MSVNSGGSVSICVMLVALPEAHCLGISEIQLAELEILIEDALKIG